MNISLQDLLILEEIDGLNLSKTLILDRDCLVLMTVVAMQRCIIKILNFGGIRLLMVT